ncbi:hypothetical protein H6F42_13630 [Pseudanabaena sp. FACHB-1998]|uniref:hypothetical protein n=1 Tax=Pseudanabaena sp. FACHB-1998 TaxID=2692858 RepID=UPI00168098F5|nr:hypothetical protein [Pseudanabaena sp. FACHB-1998]MBD2177956.1 hypothetical protein [Pseudanabaena sp. FACHB-1998]
MKQRFLSVIISALMIVSLLFSNATQAQAISGSEAMLVAAVSETESAIEAPESLAPAETEVLEPIVEAEVTETPIIAEEPTAPQESVTPTATDSTTDLLQQLETEILPQIASVLTPEQQEEFASKVAAGTSFRKAFKAVTLTPAQKTKLSTVFKAIPKKDIFATLTPAQKKQLFLKNKQLFIPTAEQIGAKMSAGKQMAGGKSSFAPSTEAIVEKINSKMKFAGEEK